MNLRRKVLYYIGLTLIASVVLLYTLSRFFLLGSFAQLEKLDTQKNVERALFAVSNKLVELNRLTGDYATWDDSYQFIEDKNKKYIEANLIDTTFNNLKLNMMIFIHSSGRIVFAKNVDLEKGEDAPFPDELLSLIAANPSLTRHPSPESSIKGILLIPQGAVLFASRPIVTSLQKGPVRGTLIFGRFFDESLVKTFSEITQLSISVKQISDPRLPPDFRAAISSLTDKKAVLVRPLSGGMVGGYALIKDFFDRPALALRVDLPRSIYQQGEAAFMYFAVFLLAAGLVLIIVISYLMEKLVLARLASLSHDVINIGASKNPAARVAVSGADELAALGSEINKSLESLERVQLEKVESEARLKEAQSLARIGNWEYDLATHDIKWSDETYELYERDKKLGPPAPDEEAGYYPPEQAKELREYARRAEEEGREFKYDLAVKLPSGRTAYFSATLNPVKDKNGRVIKLFGTVQDITDRRRAEKELEDKINELKEFHDLAVGRELKMIELEKEIERLKSENK